MPDADNERIPLLSWNVCAYTIQSTGKYLTEHIEKQPCVMDVCWWSLEIQVISAHHVIDIKLAQCDT